MRLRKSISGLFVLVLIVSVPFFFQNCASSHDDGSDAFSSAISGGQCGQILLQGFSSTGYYDFVRTNCADCHFSGGTGAGAFADGNVGVAGEQFLIKTADTISNFATSNHKAGYTGPQHTDAVNALNSAWDEVETSFQACKASGGEGGSIGGGEVTVPNMFTMPKLYNANVGQTITMSWTGAETGAAGTGVNVTLEMDLEAFDLGGDVTGYYFYAPRIVNAGAQSIFLRGLGVRVGGAMVNNGSTWYGLERYIPANDSRQLAPNGGAIVFLSAIDQPISIEIGVTELSNSLINFQPVAFDVLNGAGGVFNVSCGPCHQGNGSGGFNITYNEIVGGLGNSGLILIQKHNLDESELYGRMIDANAPMPQGGLLPAAQRDQVRDWILDGAPETDGDIAR